MLESFTSGSFEYTKLSKEEMDKRGILGRLVGPIADYKNPTRNGRKYTEALWSKTFSDPIVKEKIENKCLYGELGHPEDRLETDMSKICICLSEQPKKSNDGKLYGVFDILNTPNGKILKTLLDYGTTIGVSSRGEGDIISDGYMGEEIVDPDTYQYECHDAVLLPAVKAARLTPVTESLHNGKTLKQALLEDINNSNEEDKEVMKNALETLNINLSENIQYKGYDMTITQSGTTLRKSNGEFVMEFPTEQEAKEWVDENESMNESLTLCGYDIKLTNSGVLLSKDDFSQEFKNLDDAVKFAQSKPLNEDTSPEKDDNIEKEDEDEEADDDGSDLVIELQETLKRNAELEKVVKSLQERLSVCYAKEKKNEGQINTYRSSIKSLQESSKKASSLETKVSSLEEELETSKKTIESKNEKLKKLNEQLDNVRSEHKDKIEVASNMIVDLNKEVDSLKEELQRVKSSKNTSIATLKESYSKKESDFNDKIASLQKDSKLREKQLQEKLERTNSEVERLKGIAQKAIDKYIVEKCIALGISPQDVKNRLGKSYSFNDINRICESLSNSKLAIGNLPFKSSRVSKIQVKESLEKPMIKNLDNSGDNIDAQLLNMVDRLI